MPSFAVDGYPIAYAEAGQGEPLILVHGTLGDQRSFAPQMEALGAHFHVLSLSMRHCWPGQWEEGGDFTIDRHVADVVGVIRLLGGPVRLLGHSRGGHIAFRVAERHPELIRALVLAEPGGELDESLGGAPASGEQAANFAAAAALIGAGEVEKGLMLFAEYTGGPGAWERRPEDRRAMARDNARTLLGQKDERRAPYSRLAAEAVRAPTLLLGGDSSQPQFGTILDALDRVMANARRETVLKATHNLNLDNSAGFNQAVLAFLGAS